MTEYGVVLFYTTSAAMRAEKLLLKAGCGVKMIPPPREFSTDCGIALRFDWCRYEAVKSALDAALVETQAIHHL
jgi:hypothetical protein